MGRRRLIGRRFNYNYIVQGLSLSTRSLLVTELNRVSQGGGFTLSNIKSFNYDVINDKTSAYLDRSLPYSSSSYQDNLDLIRLVDNTSGTLTQGNLARDANNLEELILTNKTGNTAALSNTFMIRCSKLETLNLSSITRLTHNYIFSAPLLTILDVSSVVYADTRSIRGVGSLDLIDMKKCKYLGVDGQQPDFPIFTGLKSTVTINLNSFLLTSNGGLIDPYLDNLSTYYPNATINLYDDSGVLVTTL